MQMNNKRKSGIEIFQVSAFLPVLFSLLGLANALQLTDEEKILAQHSYRLDNLCPYFLGRLSNTAHGLVSHLCTV